MRSIVKCRTVSDPFVISHGRTGGASMVPYLKNDHSVLEDICLGVEMLMGFDVDERVFVVDSFAIIIAKGDLGLLAETRLGLVLVIAPGFDPVWLFHTSDAEYGLGWRYANGSEEEQPRDVHCKYESTSSSTVMTKEGK